MRSKNIKKAVSFTIRMDLLSWVDKQAKQKKMNKSQFMELALEKLQEAKLKEEMLHSYRKMKNDPETYELAAAGLEDYAAIINKYETR